MRPLLPTADRLLPYLRSIDESRVYSNMGPLTQRLRERLGAHYGTDAGAVLPLANATLGLAIALMAAEVPRGSVCMVPAWTFAASGHAILSAGLSPWMVDVDETTGCLTPALAQAMLARAPGPVGAVMVVAPFGRPLDPADWLSFRRRTGLAVVVDAAAGFDTAVAAELPSVVSMHATKVLGGGEGAFLLCDDEALVGRALAHSNFGFLGDRTSRAPSLNAKMSEYHAAVALAALDGWPETRAAFAAVLGALRAAAGDAAAWPDGLGTEWVASTASVRLAGGAERTAVRLAEAGIETRRWWGEGLHRHPAFAEFPCTPLPATERLAAETLGLPCSVDLDAVAIARIGRAVAHASSASSTTARR